MAKILVVEDDLSMAQMLEDILLAEKHIVDVCQDGDSGLYQACNYDYDLLLLDWELPDMSGIDIINSYRERGGMCPILMVTGRGTSYDKECGLDTGADDYIVKPFDKSELNARVRALMRRPKEVTRAVLAAGNIKMDTAKGRVYVDEVEVKLFPIEYSLLEYFLRHKEQLFSANDLLDRVWNSDAEATEVAVRTHIARLRKKLSGMTDQAAIETVYGAGYRLTSTPSKKTTESDR